MRLIDHTNEVWIKKVRRINGAFTYSKDLVKYQIPKWENVLDKNDLISTCPKISEVGVEGEYNTVIQYLHSFPYISAIYRVQLVHNCPRYKYKRMIFMSAYKAFANQINANGMRAIFVPMAIDVNEIKSYQQEKIYDDRIIYFGNVVQNKVGIFNKLKTICPQLGLEFDYISNDKFNDKQSLTREQILKKISQYKYGISVGRCAQEMMALDVKTIIAGQKFGGLITNEEEYQMQLDTNMNGRIVTHTENIGTAIKNIDKAITKANDITKENHTREYVNRFYVAKQ